MTAEFVTSGDIVPSCPKVSEALRQARRALWGQFEGLGALAINNLWQLRKAIQLQVANNAFCMGCHYLKWYKLGRTIFDAGYLVDYRLQVA
jgi:hypothetical protein